MHNIYQKCSTSLTQVAQHVQFNPATTASIILSVSPCRSGTTILLRVFGASSVPAHFQQLKNILRWLLQGEAFTWQIPSYPTQRIFLKETLGPYTPTESQFNPLQVLLEAGFPKEKLHILIIGRDPLATWGSWYQFWRGKTQVEYFIESYRATEIVRQQAQALEIASSVLIYECFQIHPIPQVFQALFKRLEIPYSPITIGGWDKLPAFGAVGSNIVLPTEPPVFITPDIHAPVEKAIGFIYKHRQFNLTQLKQSDIDAILASDVIDIYQNWVRNCEILDISRAVLNELF